MQFTVMCMSLLSSFNQDYFAEDNFKICDCEKMNVDYWCGFLCNIPVANEVLCICQVVEKYICIHMLVYAFHYLIR
jgi:hypothetical protein